MKSNTNREDSMIRSTLIDKFNRKALALQSAGKWEAADRLLIIALRIGG